MQWKHVACTSAEASRSKRQEALAFSERPQCFVAAPALEHWRRYARLRARVRASEWQCLLTRKQAWLRRMQKAAQMCRTLSLFQSSASQRHVRRALACWVLHMRRRRREGALVRLLASAAQKRFVCQLLALWAKTARDHRLAALFAEQQLRRRCIRAWALRAKILQRLKQTFQEVALQSNLHLQKTVVSSWFVAAALRRELKGTAFSRWRNVAERTTRRIQKVSVLEARTNQCMQKWFFAQWKDEVVMKAKGNSVVALLLQRRVLHALKKSVVESKRQKDFSLRTEITACRRLKAFLFSEWRQLLNERRQRQRQLQQLALNRIHRLQQMCWTRWRRRIVDAIALREWVSATMNASNVSLAEQPPAFNATETDGYKTSCFVGETSMPKVSRISAKRKGPSRKSLSDAADPGLHSERSYNEQQGCLGSSGKASEIEIKPGCSKRKMCTEGSISSVASVIINALPSHDWTRRTVIVPREKFQKGSLREQLVVQNPNDEEGSCTMPREQPCTDLRPKACSAGDEVAWPTITRGIEQSLPVDVEHSCKGQNLEWRPLAPTLHLLGSLHRKTDETEAKSSSLKQTSGRQRFLSESAGNSKTFSATLLRPSLHSLWGIELIAYFRKRNLLRICSEWQAAAQSNKDQRLRRAQQQLQAAPELSTTAVGTLSSPGVSLTFAHEAHSRAPTSAATKTHHAEMVQRDGFSYSKPGKPDSSWSRRQANYSRGYLLKRIRVRPLRRAKSRCKRTLRISGAHDSLCKRDTEGEIQCVYSFSSVSRSYSSVSIASSNRDLREIAFSDFEVLNS